jgi:hypothetical protein
MTAPTTTPTTTLHPRSRTTLLLGIWVELLLAGTALHPRRRTTLLLGIWVELLLAGIALHPRRRTTLLLILLRGLRV